jgi:hypothetical protein
MDQAQLIKQIDATVGKVKALELVKINCVKAFAAESLFNLPHRYNWIVEELANQLQFSMRWRRGYTAKR